MNAFALRFPDHTHADLALAPGATGLGLDPDQERGLRVAPLGEPALIELVVDQRGVWMNVMPDTWGVHVNGRPIRKLAMLHAGDSLHVEGREMVLASAASAQPVAGSARPRGCDVIPVLRGQGGAFHGQAVPVGDPANGATPLVGATVDMQDADVRVSSFDPMVPLQVNGMTVTSAWLRIGDQLVLPNGQRFLFEGPELRADAIETSVRAPMPKATPEDDTPKRMRMPWLLIAAAAIAIVLLALFWFGV
ncbi:hypothetical protein [Solilutibacter silvestris]|uniref:hypothetical protein n=1 Tax=Solilutibacter silvestris TaxID=1645665 RepID=UPI000CA03C93|nr:hypothetical protein [Lysobacter silvestris]